MTVLRLRAGETAVVGYGSLLSRASVGKTLRRPYEGPFVLCRLDGWRRSWDVTMPNRAFYFQADGGRVYPERIVYLNIRPQAACLLNVAVFVVTSEELQAMHEREWIYEPAIVTPSLRGVSIEGGDAIAYVARAEHLLREPATARQAAIRASYLRILDGALREADSAFRAEYETTTDPLPRELVIDDVLDPDRPNPWAAAGFAYRPDEQLQ